MKDRSTEVIEFLFQKHHRTYLAYARGMVHDEAIAEDIVSDSVMSVWLKRDSVENLQAYLLQTIRNNCLRYRRDTAIRDSVHRQMSKRDRDFEELYSHAIESATITPVYEKEVMEILLDTLSRMPEEASDIFIMKKFENKSYAEISQALGVSHARIDYILRKVMHALTHSLKDYSAQVAALAAVLIPTAHSILGQ